MKKKILVVLPSLEAGGAEKICLFLLDKMDRSRFSPSLACFSAAGRFSNRVPADVKVIDMKKKKRTDFIRLVFSLAFIILPREKPDVMMSFLWYANIICIIARLLSWRKPRLVTSERISIKMSPDHAGFFRHFVFRLLYPMADMITALSGGVGREMAEIFRINPEKVRVILNGIDCEKMDQLCREPIEIGDVFHKQGAFRIISCGRLTSQKNFQLLIRTFARLPENSSAELVIMGYGEDLEMLASLAENLGVADRVILPGYRANPWKYMAASDVFVLCSLYEGFGNVIIEAMASGVPVVSVDCPHGPSEIISNGKNGLLVPLNDEDSLLQAVQRVRKDKNFGKELVKAGKETAQNLDVRKMVKKYEEIF